MNLNVYKYNSHLNAFKNINAQDYCLIGLFFFHFCNFLNKSLVSDLKLICRKINQIAIVMLYK